MSGARDHVPCEPRSQKRGAMVLSATLALGSCQMASCNDADEDKAASTASATHSPLDEETSATAEPDIDATEARVAEIETSPGFTPDPTTCSGTTAGGPLDVNHLDDRCHGWVDSQPDAILQAARPFAELAVMAASRDDATLLVVGPDGEARCGDDEDGTNPVVRGFFAAGLHRVWVGTRERGVEAAFVLGLSELDDARPSSLAY